MEDEKPPVEENNMSLQSLEMIMTLEEERERTSDYDGSHNSNEQITWESDNVMCSNPVYQNTDDETVLKMAKPDYEIVDTVTDETKRTDPTPHYIDVIHTTNQETYPPKADYASITTVDSTEVNNRQQDDNLKQDGYMETKHEESAEGKDTALLYVDTPHVDHENVGSSDQPTFISNREFDEESRELIISSKEKQKSSNSSPSNHGYISETITTDVNSEQTDDLLDEEPDVDYNDKQVRFSTVVLDTEKNKFEPIKLENSKTPSDGESLPTEIENENNITDGKSQSQLVDDMNEELTLGEKENAEITAF